MYIKSRAIGFLTVIFVAVFCFILIASSTNKIIEPEASLKGSGYAPTEPMIISAPAFVVGAMASSESKVEEVIYPLTEEEINLIALVTMGEAEGETELGKRLVIDTILNRADDPHFPDTVTDVIYQPNQFSVMWNGRLDRCYIMPKIVELVKEELLERTNSDVIFFMAGGYSIYGTPLFQECCHYFSSYE